MNELVLVPNVRFSEIHAGMAVKWGIAYRQVQVWGMSDHPNRDAEVAAWTASRDELAERIAKVDPGFWGLR